MREYGRILRLFHFERDFFILHLGVIILIDLINVTKKYETPDGHITALNDVSLHIEKGEIFGIIGLSGAGKSSLIRCINLLEVPTSGKVLVDSTDITKLNGKDLRDMRKRIGMIFQHFNLLMNSTVYENIAFPLKISGMDKDKINKRVIELLEVVELTDKKDVYPSRLSGGQKQRVGIARALATNPDIILSDEATSALDPATTQSILNLLKNINREFGITIVVITHEMAVVKSLCDKVAVMENGIIVEQGIVRELFSNPQNKTSREFLKDMTAKLPEGILINNNPEEKVLRISFIGDDANKPFISHMVKEFDVDANIIAGNIESIQNMQIGSLIVKLSGREKNIELAENYLSSNNLRIEVIKNGMA